jgi:beta-glucanase (GH16 family)
VAIDPNNLSATATLTFSEDFNSFNLWNGTTGLDTRPGWAMWPQFDNGFTESGNGEQEWFIQPGDAQTASLNPFSVQNGVLTISANPTPPSMLQYTNNQPYTSGWIDTYHEFSQTYGYFEMRAELPAGQGLWPSFWLLPKDNSWPPELDVMEMIGNQPNELVTTVHSQISGTREISANHFATGAGTYAPGMTTGFHTYGVDWEPNTITWYLDGQQVFQTATPTDLNKPMYMIADLGVGGYWPGNPDSTTPFPAQMQIDYLRAYEPASQSSPGGTSGDPQPTSPPPPPPLLPPPPTTPGPAPPPPPSGSNSAATTSIIPNRGPDEILWRNGADGTLASWMMSGAQVTSDQQVMLQGAAVAPDRGWSVAGIGDFNGDGNSDILWRNANGKLIDWSMNGGQVTSAQAVTSHGNAVAPDALWSVVGTGDFNGDGSSDILWRNANGTLIEWTMNGSQIASCQAVTLNGKAATPDASWSIAGIGDFNGDGSSDILWRNTNGALIDWTMDGSQIASAQQLTLQGDAATPDANWSVIAIGDYNGEGRADILWRDTNGTLIDWTMNGSQITNEQQVTFGGSPVSLSSSWQIAQIGDFNGNGTSDILLRNSTNGAMAEWSMNGAQIASSTQLSFQGNLAAPSNTWTTLSKPTDFFV